MKGSPLLLTALAVAAVARVDAETTVPIAQPVPDVAGATLTGHLPGNTVLTVSVALLPRDRAGLKAYVDAVNTPNGPLYHRFLKPKEIGARFGASSATVSAVATYLKSKGLAVTLVSDSGTALIARGKASAAESAFGTTLNLYSAPARKDGPTSFYRYASAPKLPKSWASQVVAVGGLQTALVARPAGTLTMTQARHLYGVDPLYATAGRKGDGVTIGITNYDAYRLSNLPLLYSYYNLPAPDGGVGSNVSKVSIDGSDGEARPFASGEGDLDIECVLSVAPRCNLVIYDTSSYGDGIALLARMAQDDRVDVATESYGFDLSAGSAAFRTAEYDQHLILAAEGVTYLCASGDIGTYGFDYPSTDPDVLSVGGTYTTFASDGTRISEDGWDGSGGGYRPYDVFWNRRPVYQTNSIVSFPVPSSVDRRLFPDLALQANGSNTLDPRDPRYVSNGYAVLAYYLFFQGQFGAGAGTSAASPFFAGQLGLVLQDLKAQGVVDLFADGSLRLGRLQDFLYETVGNDPSVFYDVTTGDNGPLAFGGESTGTTGWDTVTGFGAPNAGGLRDAIFANSLAVVRDVASSTTIYAIASPTLTLGTNPQGNAGLLASMDGTTYSVQSVKESGLGQVAATTIGFSLTGNPTLRRTASVDLAFALPTNVTGYVYLRNVSTGVYDLASTVPGTGATAETRLPGIDLSKYVGSDNTVGVLVRAVKPTRLGTTPFRLSIDMANVLEQVKRG